LREGIVSVLSGFRIKHIEPTKTPGEVVEQMRAISILIPSGMKNVRNEFAKSEKGETVHAELCYSAGIPLQKHYTPNSEAPLKK
jgi:hypothetical protein